MCGIVGFVGPGDRDDLEAMMDALVHRGPDGEGSYVDPAVPLFLGHRRLAVIDIVGGAQPMWNDDESIGVVFNGEIYNHRALRGELEALGHRFRTTHSDTEVLVHGYREWGRDLPIRLNGMFAFCIYDRRRGQLFLARDRFGEKPLYFARQNKLFAFASELSAIARHSGFHVRLRTRSVQKFLAHGFLPAPNSILEDCEKLPAGAALTFDLSSGSMRQWRYWQFRVEPEGAWLERSEEELAEELRTHLIEAVRRRLVADVPLGFFLSGGIDSSAVVAAAATLLPADKLHTFTLGFNDPSFDESGPAKLVADMLGTCHATEWLDLETARDIAPMVLGMLDEPSGDASILPTYLLSRFARRHVTVALSGDGGDELFAGYDPFAALAPARLYRSFVPRPFHKLLREAARRLPIAGGNMSLEFRIKRTLSGLDHAPSLWNPVWLAPVDPGFMTELFEEPLTPEELYSEALEVWESSGTGSLVDRTLEYYTNFYLPDGILNKVDRATMMCSLESRAIFLDNDLVEFCRRLPHTFKLRNGRRKYLLKRALEGMLPASIINRKKKGFGIPAAEWLRHMPRDPPLAPMGGVLMNRVEKAWRDHRNRSADHRLFLWSWLSLQSLPYGRLAMA